MIDFKVLIEHGGFAVWLIFAAGFILVTIGFERVVTLFFTLSYNTRGTLKQLQNYISQRKYVEALQICQAQKDALDIQVVRDGLIAVENGREAMKSALGGSLITVTERCEARLSYLALIANVATLLGLLGTISGLIKTFAAIADADPSTKARLLGIGISEAMYATATGLMVGIFAMVLHTICLAKSDRIVNSAQEAAMNLIKWVEQSERAEAHVR
jgi:biopolymer transport protein ExbB